MSFCYLWNMWIYHPSGKYNLTLAKKIFELFHGGGCYHTETSPLICSANQWTGWFLYNGLCHQVNPLSTNSTKWSNTLKQFVGNLLTNCLSVFDHFVGLALKGLMKTQTVVFKLLTLFTSTINFGHVSVNLFTSIYLGNTCSKPTI